MHISEMEWDIEKKSCVFGIKAFEVVAENSAHCAGILVIGSQCVRKQS